eukprot:GHVL01007511.1.p1 GENE.GHVL01007511.1~~GHVL01007511.1.p1  ORF type:complete len:337 (-),score=58.17 GHVL01007511.1:132-1142(-)
MTQILFQFCPFDGRRYRQDEMVCSICGEPRFYLSSSGRNPAKKWEKILWSKQNCEDNWVDETFLNSLITNANVNDYCYWSLCRDTVSITQHISFICIWLCVWQMLSTSIITCELITIIDIFLLINGYILHLYLSKLPISTIFRGLTSAGNVFGTLWIVTPILQTLTKSFSDDTVFLLASILILIHIIFHDYMYVQRVSKIEEINEEMTCYKALNAAVFASVLLASRLDTPTQVFAFMFFAVETFALSPLLLRCMRQSLPNFTIFVLTPVVWLFTSWLLSLDRHISQYNSSYIYNASLYIISIFSITFIAPLSLMKAQKMKNEIRGPWDIAHIQEMT